MGPTPYTPQPFETSHVELPPDLIQLTEKLAENAHEIWAAERVSQGWVYGQERNDKLKTTPCLVPYDELPETEKQYDRNAAMETLKLVVALGYRVEKVE